jgi:hypothetical protein
MESNLAERAAAEILRVLAVPGTTHFIVPFGPDKCSLYAACDRPGVDTSIVHHLLDVDPTVLLIE